MTKSQHMNIYQRKNGVWEGYRKMGNHPDGTIYYSYALNEEPDEVMEELKELTKEAAIPITRVYQWTNHWLEEAERHFGLEKAYIDYQIIERYIVPILSHRLLKELDQGMMQRVVNSWITDYELSEEKVQRVFQKVKQIFTAAYEKGYLEENICQGILFDCYK
ncbi:hypothetical protein IGI37_003776 [Enterococcus sp. AZ194]|uniref:hypothetical protein n=1 Tax=Enterococcus sp. AZ194 TaxID=2774629 RepID=UPI003F28C03D